MAPLAAPITVSVIVPVYNEISTVREALDALTAKRIPGYDFQIIIVESNSSDGSRAVVLSYRDRPGVQVILEEAPRGKGHAVRAGLAAATGDVIMIQDADLEYDLADYERLLAPLAAGEWMFVMGTRHARQGWAIRKFTDDKLRAAILNVAHWTFALMLNASLGIWLTDPFTMYKVFRRECIAGLRLECNRFDFDWELLIKLVRRGYHPLEIPVYYRSRSFSEGKKVSMVRDPITWMVALVKYRFQPI
ncbi:MAG TPA: glycosyltransferase family 2 protein [Opitutaceae bacterium]|jgi:glycosyltransferase involved in cell wall biosynthesis